jgi:hypothetical protein
VLQRIGRTLSKIETILSGKLSLTTLKKTSNNYRKKLSKISRSISCLVEVNIYPSNVPTNQNCLNDVVTVFNVNGNQVTNSTCQNYTLDDV